MRETGNEEMAESEGEVNRSDIMQLIKRREDIDEQIQALGGILTSVLERNILCRDYNVD